MNRRKVPKKEARVPQQLKTRRRGVELCEKPKHTYNLRERPPLRTEEDPGNGANVHVIKVLDRSLDLAKHDETTTRNLRGQRPPSPKKREMSADLLEKFNAAAIKEVTSLPAPEEATCSRVPSPTPEQRAARKENIDLNYDLEAPSMSRDELRAELKQRWTKIRSQWMANTKPYNQRYSASFELLDAMYSKL